MTTTDAPTLGPLVCRWIEATLVHGPGDYLGQPIQLRPWQVEFISRAYELTADGRRRYDRALLGLPKGSGKTELAAMLALVELAGPCLFTRFDAKGRPLAAARPSPDIPIAAASFEQARILFDAAREMVRGGPLLNHFDVFDTEIVAKAGHGRLYRIYSAPRTNDGLKPSFVACDELHEWVAGTAELYVKLTNGRAKRADSWELLISTAGWDTSTVLGRLYSHGKKIESGEISDDRFLFEWHEAPADLDLEDPDQLREAIRIAHPAAGDWLSVETIERQYMDRTLPPHEFRRYWLNQWASSPDRWLPEGAFEALTTEREVDYGTEIVLGFDGSISDDSTVIIGATCEEVPHLWIHAMWEKPDRGDFVVDPLDVRAALLDAAKRYNVRSVGADPYRYRDTLAVVADAGVNVLEWPTGQAARATPATLALYEAVVHGKLTHDGDPRLIRHFANATLKVDHNGTRLRKDPRNQANKIDAAVASMIAFDMALRAPAEPEYNILSIGGRR
jgi:phage terminase large subunit-like protein